MNQFVRISTGFLRHPKTGRLQRELGDAGVLSLIALWLWAGEQRPNGDLSGLDDEDIEYSANWRGESGDFIAALVKLRWLDGEPGHYVLHGWDSSVQNPSGRYRLRVLARYHPDIYRELRRQGVNSLSQSEYAAIASGSSPAEVLSLASEAPTAKEIRTEQAADKIAAALAPILDPDARGGEGEQVQAVDALLVFPHEGGKLKREAAVEWVARKQSQYPGVNIAQAIRDAALSVTGRRTPIKNPRLFMSRWLERAYGKKH